MKDQSFLSRWSRRKTEAKQTSEVGPERPSAGVVPAQAGTQSPSAPPEEQLPEPLPPVDSLTPESDFTPFMNPEVDAATKRQALKKLFEDPRFNVMDGLDVYIDDYSKPDPLPEGWLEKMNQVARLGIFSDPREERDREAPAGEERREKSASEAPELPAAEVSPPDTSSGGSPRTKVGESERVDTPKRE